MIFSNPNFIRGNKHRCLLMRSIVNRKPQHQSSSNQAVVPPPSRRVGAAAGAVVDHGGFMIPAAAADPRFHLARTATNNNNTLQDHHGFSLNVALGHQEQQYAYANMIARQQGKVQASSTKGFCLPALSPHADLLTLMYPPTIGTSSSSTYWTIPTSQQHPVVPQHHPVLIVDIPATSASVTAPTMSVLFEPRHQHHHNFETTTILSQQQQQSVAGGINVGSTKRIDSLPANATTTMSPFNLSLPPGWPPPPPAAGAAAMRYQSGVQLDTTAVGTRPSTMINTVGNSVNVIAPAVIMINTVGNSVNVVAPAVMLASQIMRNNPGMEQWRALELAKRMCGVVSESDTAFGTGSSLP